MAPQPFQMVLAALATPISNPIVERWRPLGASARETIQRCFPTEETGINVSLSDDRLFVVVQIDTAEVSPCVIGYLENRLLNAGISYWNGGCFHPA